VGEAAAAFLTRSGLAYAVSSQDYDSILFSTKRLVRNLTVSGKRKIPNRNAYVDVEPEVIEHLKVLTETGLSQEQLIDVAILIGTDFNPGGFSGIGPKTALKLVKESGRLENISKIKDQLAEVPYQEIRDIFLNAEEPDVKDLSFGSVDRQSTLQYLCAEKGFSGDRVSAALDRLEKAEASRSQSLERWF
jgi:flap endonuclease-1